MPRPLPLISCICVTNNRPRLLQRAIACFEAQTYPEKELIILYESHDTGTQRFIEQNEMNENIRFITIKKSPEKKLGYLRNLAISVASGSFICQWDDDDWYHPARLAYQFSKLQDSGYKGSVLTRLLIFDSITQNTYNSYPRLWEGSILCEKGTLQGCEYLNADRGEDTAVIDFLFLNDMLQLVSDAAQLYIYNYHGNNTWGYDHFRQFFKHSELLSAGSRQHINSLMSRDPNINNIIEDALLLDSFF